METKAGIKMEGWEMCGENELLKSRKREVEGDRENEREIGERG